ncbi:MULTISPECIES: hypothetical protein [Enterococcus]|jgi:hypothetical protein|uniref:hypothetical protein n=1 Tax=Enterococcus TaxID=1350 RepID=UPI00032EEE3E|nr:MULTISPECIES: hypothetical protein [Enterococcus]HEM8039008.1 hypothetical protein [Klebsiella aerogenes]EGO2558481.1 hypothetical protein [Enterococcus faecalis]EGO2702989.1 hypothetical protein [Enterococcus faecalis]EGO2825227.1 hypothetical protein [Enterococcus faecalis]EGO2827832.1 hypothetical protein [Enterococcus faecalis]
MKIKTKKYNVEVNHVHVNQKNNLFGTLKITSINPAFVSDTKKPTENHIICGTCHCSASNIRA